MTATFLCFQCGKPWDNYFRLALYIDGIAYVFCSEECIAMYLQDRIDARAKEKPAVVPTVVGH